MRALSFIILVLVERLSIEYVDVCVASLEEMESSAEAKDARSYDDDFGIFL